jgi:hypothetical protein
MCNVLNMHNVNVHLNFILQTLLFQYCILFLPNMIQMNPIKLKLDMFTNSINEKNGTPLKAWINYQMQDLSLNVAKNHIKPLSHQH